MTTCTVVVIGLGYVGLPLAVEFAKKRPCCRTGAPLKRRLIGFDVNSNRIRELLEGHDRTNEISAKDLRESKNLLFTSDDSLLKGADIFIVSVPTPIDSCKRPNLEPLKRASTMVGHALRARVESGSKSLPLVIYESTVYPGATEEICVPILESSSGLRFNQDFSCGYSPERINPGDSQHRLTTITKVTSGSTPESSTWIDDFYGSIVEAGTYKAPSIKVAEAAKVIENTQRDLNIALVNELALIFDRLGIDTHDVLEAAGTKWNFLPFQPGLVGGHCIGVDPYYLTHKAEQVGYSPQVVLAGRRINDSMGEWVATRLVVEMARRSLVIGGTRVLVLGLTFKENCPDLRNTKVIDLIAALRTYGIQPVVVDPWVDPQEAMCVYQLSVLSSIPSDIRYSAIVVAVAHYQFAILETQDWQDLLATDGVLLDLKAIVPRELGAVRL